jgi:UPF0755 protein
MLKRIIIVSVIILAAAFSFTFLKLNEKIGSGADVYITIPKNTPIKQAIMIANGEGALKPAWFFSIVSKIYGRLSRERLHEGCYRFRANTSNVQVLYSIFSGKQVYTISVTYPEGIALRQFASITAKKLDIDSAEFVRLANSDSVLEEYNIPGKSAEGYLMPNTYMFYWKEPAIEVIKILIEKQDKVWNEQFKKIADSIGKSRHEILTLASMVEAESPVADERPVVSGLFVNRLRIGRKLESDPTVQYALGVKKRLLYSDLEVKSTYNTYKYPGLPPGPINSPSVSSIKAALYPAKHDYIYFVSKGDGSGRHNFSKTFSQHSYYVNLYRKKIRAERQ